MTIQVGSISTDTLRAQDLIPKFIGALPYASEQSEWWAKVARQLLEYGDTTEGYLGTLDEIRAGLEDALNQYAQTEGLYFGTLEGDASDFGFWKVVEECDECGREIRDEEGDLVNPGHQRSCSLHPDNVIEATA